MKVKKAVSENQFSETAFYLHSAEDSHLWRWRDECRFCFPAQRVFKRPLNEEWKAS